jgi:hypothetical protein
MAGEKSRSTKEVECSLRKAFVETLKDLDFIADAKKSRLDTNPLTGEKIVLQLFEMDAALVHQLKEILK